MSEINHLWKRIILGKYKQEGGWCTKEIREKGGEGGYRRQSNMDGRFSKIIQAIRLVPG